ncbi:hypothetical protein I4U23_005852, partial [Adineta vaga]
MATSQKIISLSYSRRKIALIIGIGDYIMGKQLPNAINDAKDMSKELKKIGFIIHNDGEAKLNLTYKEMRRTLTDFECSIEKGDMVLFYFAGHGTQWEDQNYLIPINNFKEENETKVELSGSDLKKYSINAQNLLNNIDDREPFLIMFFLDCWRTYHLRHMELQRNTREYSNNNSLHGLQSMPIKVGSLIAFACAPGTTADEGNNQEKNGLFTKYLLQHISKPNEDILEILRDVTRDVINESNKKQIPHVTSVLTHRNIYLNEIKQDSFESSIKQLSISTMNKSTIKQKQKTKFQQNGTIVAGGNGDGNQLNQLYCPQGIFVDENKNIFIADCDNHRIFGWKCDEKQGQIIAGGNGEGERIDQLNCPSDVIVDQQNHSIIIADRGNRRVMRWSRDQKQQILIQNVDCWGLTMDQHGFIYVSDWKKNEVRKWKLEKINENKEGTLVAGGNGKGNQRNQFNFPMFIFVDKDQSLYASDEKNHRVMKWRKDAKEGIVVAGGNDEGNNLNQLNGPRGLFVDEWNQIYVADWGNNRIMRWCEGDEEGEIVVGGNGKGSESNQLNCPYGLSFDSEGNLYVSD